MTRHDLVDRFRLDHPGREMWTWLDSSHSAKAGSYLDRVLEELVVEPISELTPQMNFSLMRASSDNQRQ